MVRVYFANGYKLDCFEALASVIWKNVHCCTDWEGYQYGFRFSQITHKDQQKLKTLLPDLPSSEELPEVARHIKGGALFSQNVPDLPF